MMRTICVLVLYNPSREIVTKTIDAIVNQVDFVWISDNTPGGSDFWKNEGGITAGKVKYAKMNGNVGIAKAQNEGVKYAIEKGYEYIYFLDQDSISPNGIVEGLVNSLAEIESRGINVGGVGPLPYNRETGKPYKTDIVGNLEGDNDIYEVKDLMNSASLIKTDLFREVGLMDEWLFIDGVDYELCWRAAHMAGFRFFINNSLYLSHKLGEGDKKILGASLKISTPFRTYYQFRNYIYLSSKRYVPKSWKVTNGLKYIAKYFFFPIFCKPRMQYFKRINKGIADGIRHK